MRRGFFDAISRVPKPPPTFLVVENFLTQSVGAGVTGPFSLSRASAQTARDLVNGTAVTSIGNNTAAIDNVAGNYTGLGHFPTRTNLVQNNRNPQAAGWNASSAGVTNTFAAFTGPDGTPNIASRSQVPGNGFGKAASSTLTAGSKIAFTHWVMRGSAGALFQSTTGHSTVIATGGTAPTGWTLIQLLRTNDLSPEVSYPGVDGQNEATHGGIVAGARDVIYDMLQVEVGAYATSTFNTSGGAAARAGQRLFLATGTNAVASGSIAITDEFVAPCTIANNDSAIRFWSDPNDATSFCELSTAGTLTTEIGGVTNTCTISGWNPGDYVKVYIKAGGTSATVVQYQINKAQVVVPAITGGALGNFAPVGNLDVLCAGTTKQVAGTHRILGFLAAGSTPRWTV